MDKYGTEFLGTFFLVLTIGVVVIPGPGPLVAPLAVGSVLTVLVYAGGPISNAHYNPAVTLAFLARGRIAARDVVPYILAQLAGAALAAVTASWLAGPATAIVIDDVPRALLAELLFTFALMHVILHVATTRASVGNPYYGVAIGLVVTAGIFAVGDISGAVFNPAVALGTVLMGLFEISVSWIHVVGAVAGALAATGVFKLLHPDEP